MRTPEEFEKIQEIIDKQNINFIDFKVVDLIGRWRHVTIPVSKFNTRLMEEGIGFDGSTYGYRKVQDSDMLIIPDIKTLKVEETSQRSLISMIGDIYEVGKNGDKKPSGQDPRRTAKKAVQYLKESGVADSCWLSPEFEFYIFDRCRFEYTHNKGLFEIHSEEGGWSEKENDLGYYLDIETSYHAPRPGDKFMDLRNGISSFLEREGVSVKYHHHEMGGAGESEIEIDSTELVEAADNTLFIKHTVKTFAYRYGKSATFMPKPLYKYPGNGMHIHQYMIKNDKNIFSGSEYSGLSKIALWYIGGILEHGKSLMALTNPSTNSYKRLVPGQDAPINLVFSRANRTCAIRIPGYIQSPSKARIELRTIDATCNPYLAYSAVLMAGLDGVENELDPEKYGPIDKNVYQLPKEKRKKITHTPRSLEEALDELEKDHQFLLKGKVFTEHQIENWINTKRSEAARFYDRPHPYEHILYYDI